MAGEIKHRWDGTVLTITSDSGTSSMDLKGEKGNVGIRGPQGRAGVILKEDGSVDMNGYATEAYVIDAIEVALEDYTPSGGGGGGTGGGGGSTNNAEMTLKSTTGWTYKTVADSSTCAISGTWSSIEEELPTGSGTMILYINNAIKLTRSIPQGDFIVDITKYLNSGNNTVKIKITDVYGNARTIAFTVNKLSLTITSTFDDTVPYSESINFPYTPTGNATKTVHFIMDGIEIGTAEVTTSGRQQNFTVAKKAHGSHKFEVYFTVDLDGELVPSNHLYYDIMFTTIGTTTPIISCSYNKTDITQFETINIPYVVYSPSNLVSNITLNVNGKPIKELTVDRTKQTWVYRADDAGEVELTITCGGVVKPILLNVAESPIDVKPTVENIELILSSYGRSNNEANPASWEYEDIKCSFRNYNWISDGWQTDEDGITVHRVSGDARLTIPLKMFASDFRTTGKTIEFEFATRDVRNYDAEIVSCYANNIGFKMTAQKALLKSEQSEIFTQYKEDEHVRVSFVVEKKAENRLILIYLNGIMCGAVQYPTDDDFSQTTPVNISIGSNDCTIDLYNIRIYNNDLTRHQIVDNWIADTQDIALRADRYARNDIYDAYGNIVIANLPANLPYMILTGSTLPQYKGNKIDVDGEFVDPVHPNKSFKFANGDIDVQGTSSAGYARKNYLLKLTNGLNQNGIIKENYQMRNDSIPTDVFCFKADVASSEGCNNVELVRLYDKASPFRTTPQRMNASIRQGIDGFPMVIFHNNGETIEFIGKYNFNNDKSTPEIFGMTTGDESWEIRNNTSNRVLWKSADFNGTDWQNDFEARYPKNNINISNLKRFAEWVVSTDTTQATNLSLPNSVTYDETTYTQDTAAYRLAKFKHELDDYAEKDSALFYYLFTELFLMVDSRAKNAFPSLVGSNKICWLPYDMDTAIGINNEGALTYGYSLEDTDITESGADVYNGQDSVFWCNIRDCFGDELKEMYKDLRSNNLISYDVVEGEFEAHQAVWPEAIWNEDAYYKYIEPLIEDGAGIYLPMLQGSKSEQRKWWLYNRFRYIDSKYNAGDSLKDFITLRGYAKQNITLEPYADIYASIKYGSYLEQTRALRGGKYTLPCPLDNVNDTEIYIYSASQIKDVGDLSGFKVGLADFSMATKIQSLKLGDESSTYSNGNLKSLTLGNNELLKTIDVRNCGALGTGEQQSVDISGCKNIEEVYFTGTNIKGITLPNGGVLKTLHLPATITNLTILNQSSLSDFRLDGYTNITTLRLEGVDTKVVPTFDIIRAMPTGGRVRIINADWDLEDSAVCAEVFYKLGTMRGLDENGNNVDKIQLSGKIAIPYLSRDNLPTWQALYPNVEFIVKPFSLSGCTWAEIGQLIETGEAVDMFNVGEEKTIVLTTGEEATAVLIGKNHDDLADGTGKATLTFEFKDALLTEYIMDKTESRSYCADWRDSDIKKTHLTKILNTFPSDLQALIKEITKQTGYIYTNSNSSGMSGPISTTEKLFLLSREEIYGSNVFYHEDADGYPCSKAGEGEQYQYYKEAPIPDDGVWIAVNTDDGTGTCYALDTISMAHPITGSTLLWGAKMYQNFRAYKRVGKNGTSSASYWLRSAYAGSSNLGTAWDYKDPSRQRYCTGTGSSTQYTAQNLAPAFCI